MRIHLNINAIATMIKESGGCEPEFAISFVRKTEGLNNGEESYNNVYCRAAEEYKNLYGTDQFPDYFVTAEDIYWFDRVKTQAVMQNHVDTAISSTINLPESATKDDIAGIYLEAWKQGIKGITIFRSGCMRVPVLSANKEKDIAPTYTPVPEECIDDIPRGFILDASDNVVGKKRKLITGCGTLHVTAFFDPITGDLMETYLSKGSTGGCNNFMIGLSRMISLAARSGVEVPDIVDQLDSCGVCPSYAVRRATKHDTSKGSCCPMAVGNALMDMWKEMVHELAYDEECEPDFPVAEPVQMINFSVKSDPCPECGQPLIHEGGCDICKNCGWSKCG